MCTVYFKDGCRDAVYIKTEKNKDGFKGQCLNREDTDSLSVLVRQQIKLSFFYPYQYGSTTFPCGRRRYKKLQTASRL